MTITRRPIQNTQPQDEQRFREIGERLVRCTNATEENHLKAELVRAILRGQPSRQQHAMRELACTFAARV
jgi:hypothetical protein